MAGATVAVAVISPAVVAAGAPAAAAPSASAVPGAAEAKKIFNQRCTACHTFGHGIKVGPDLKGVNDRRKRPWILSFVRSSQKMIASGDETATKLFAEFKQQRMPDWTDLSPQQINSIMDWFAANGPEQKEPDEKNAELATVADLDRARALFTGETPLASGGLACNTCHSVSAAAEGGSGGSLGPDLSDTYARYQDRALTLFFKRPCTPRMPEMSAATYLLPEESFALKAFLRQASLPPKQGER